MSQPETTPLESDSLLLIADISGYTRFMLTNRTARVHAHGIVSDLLEAVSSAASPPLKVNKLQGDAVFLVGLQDPQDWSATGSALGQRLTDFQTAFHKRLQELAGSNVCGCVACQSMVSLRLKLIGHYGTVVQSTVAGFTEVSGVDVIVLHRLLKNTVKGSEYILLTEEAFRFLNPAGTYRAHRERYEDVGEIDLRLLDLQSEPPADARPRFSIRDMGRKLTYDIRYWMSRKHHPAA